MWDIVQHFDTHGFGELVKILTGVHELHKRLIEVDGGRVDPEFEKNVLGILKRVQAYCANVDFQECEDWARNAIVRIKNGAVPENVSALNKDLQYARDALIKETTYREFILVPHELSNYIDEEFLFGKGVYDAFPKARADVTGAGNCIALDLPDGAVFYLMRVAEYGLRSLAKRLGVMVTHRGARQRIEDADWDKVITAIKNKIDSIRHLTIGPRRKAQLELYSDAADHCLFIRDIYRNEISHTQKPYKPKEALAAFERVRDFMEFLSAGLGKITR